MTGVHAATGDLPWRAGSLWRRKDGGRCTCMRYAWRTAQEVTDRDHYELGASNSGSELLAEDCGARKELSMA